MAARACALRAVIDLHSHILPGIDDGAGELEASVSMAHTAVAEGIDRIAATPHVSADYEYDLGSIPRLAHELSRELAEREIPLAIVPGAEVALERVGELSEDQLRGLCLGEGPYLLVESPYASSAPFIDDAIFNLQVLGLRPVLAHPERCPHFHADLARLATLAERGVLCSVNAGSMAGRFGPGAQRLALRLFRQGLVHNVASDSHDAQRRPPALATGFEHAEARLPGLWAQMDWYVETAPAAILAGDDLPPAPDPPAPRRARWLRAARRR